VFALTVRVVFAAPAARALRAQCACVEHPLTVCSVLVERVISARVMLICVLGRALEQGFIINKKLFYAFL
jgi:hypothetical protein